MNRLIVMGSPRSAGRSARLAELVFEACIEECPDDELALVPVSELSITVKIDKLIYNERKETWRIRP